MGSAALDGRPCPSSISSARVSTREQLHHQVQRAVAGLTLIEDLDDVRVSDALGGFGFSTEALAGHRILGQLRVHHLDGDVPVAQPVPGTVDRGHPAFAQHLLDLVAAGDGGADTRILDVDQSCAVDEAHRLVGRVLELALRAGLHG